MVHKEEAVPPEEMPQWSIFCDRMVIEPHHYSYGPRARKKNMGLSIGYSSDSKIWSTQQYSIQYPVYRTDEVHTVYKWIMGKYIIGYCCYRMSRKGMHRAMYSGTILLTWTEVSLLQKRYS